MTSSADDYNGRDVSITFEHEYYGRGSIDFDDIILRHKDEHYDHIRVLHYTEGLSMQAVFLGRVALDQLAEMGVGEAYLEEPTAMTIRSFRSDLLNRLDAQVDPELEE